MIMLVVVTSCRQIEPLVEQELSQGPEFTAEIESFDPETKTALDGNSVVWSAADQIAVFQGTAKADKYQVDEDCIGTKEGIFAIVAKGETSSAENFNANIAIYPYQDSLTVTPISATEYQIIGVTIPSTQTYTANTFSNGSFLMAAITDGLTDHILSFRNLCGALKLQLKGTAKIKSIELKGNDGEPLSGATAITIYNDGSSPTLEMSENASAMVSVNWIDGVQLNPDTATPFFITIPPTSFEKGFTVKIIDIMGDEATVQTSKSNVVSRSYVHTMPEVTIEPTLPSVNESAMSGLSIACIGNSITQGVGANGNPYPTQLASRLNATVKNLGASGTSLCQGGARTCNIGKLTEANCAGMDVVTIMMGINDWAAARNNSTDGVYYHLGDINSTETNCIYGAMRMWCDKIEELRNTESCANTRFYFMTPIITSWNSSVTSTRNWDQSKTNVHGFTLRDLCHAIIDVATEYDIPVIDLNLCSGIYYNSATDENVSLYGGDGVHINEAGHSMVTDAIIRALASDEEFKAYTPHIELGALSTLGVWAKNFYDRQYYRTPRYMQVTDSNVEIKVKDDCDVRVCQYDADFKFIKIIDFTQVMANEGKTFKLDASCEYIRLVFRKDSSLPQFEKPEVYVKNVEAKEYFEPRPADDGYQKILAHVEVDGQILPDYGVVCLPETYSNVGEPTRLIIFCHGAAVNYPSSVSRFVASDINPEYWLKEGYAIMDIEGNPFDNTNEHFYIPQAIQCYKAAYDWVTATYNIRTDGVFLGGRSMGGGMCFEILRSDIPVIAACPVVPACNQLWYWNYADADRKKFCSEKMGFTGTQPAWTSSKKLTDAEYDYLYANFDKMLSCSPFWSGIENLPSKDELFSVGRVSANTAYDEAEANLYSTLKFRAKAPVKIFTCYEDNTVPYQRNAQLMYNMMVNAGMECELSLVHTDASTPHRYEQQDSNANITVTTRFGETMSAPWVYVDMVKFWRKYE